MGGAPSRSAAAVARGTVPQASTTNVGERLRPALSSTHGATSLAAPTSVGGPSGGGSAWESARLLEQVRALADAQAELLQVVDTLSRDIARLRSQQQHLQHLSSKPVELLSKDLERFQAQQQQQLEQLQQEPKKVMDSLTRDIEHLRAQQQQLEQSQQQPSKVVETLASDVGLLRTQLRQLQQLHENLQWQQQQEAKLREPGDPQRSDGVRAGQRSQASLEHELEKCQAEGRERHFASVRELARHWALLEELQMLHAEGSARQRLIGEELASLGASVEATRDEVSILVTSVRRVERQLTTIREDGCYEASQAHGDVANLMADFQQELSRVSSSQAGLYQANGELVELAGELQQELSRVSAGQVGLNQANGYIAKFAETLQQDMSQVSSGKAGLHQDLSELSQIVAHLRSGHGEFISMCEDLRKEQAELEQRVADLDDQLWLMDERLGSRLDDKAAVPASWSAALRGATLGD